MKKIFLICLLCSMIVFVGASFASDGVDDFQDNMQRNFVRGLKNIVSAPFEIPYRVHEHYKGEQRPVFRDIAGFVDGTFQMISRLGSGLFDLVVAFVPGDQAGYPVEPETFF